MMLNLLQRGFQPGANPPPNLENNAGFLAGLVIGYVCGIGVLVILSYGPYVLILLRQMQALNEVRERNRGVAPGLVWLGLIPLLTYAWTFVTAAKTDAALADEFGDRRMRDRGDNGKGLGVTYAVLNLLNGVVGVLATVVGLLGIPAPIGCLNFVLILAMLVVAILYAGKLNAATQRLRRHSDKYDDRDEDDERPRRKPKRPPEDDDEFDEYDEPKGGR